MPTPDHTALAGQLAQFSQTHGTSGFEDNVRALVLREFKKLVDETRVTPLGSVIGIKRATRARGARGPQDTPRLLVEAHMDEIGFIVTGIEDGFIRFDEIGMFDPRVLPSQNVLVHGRRTLPGVIGARPPHVLSAEERKRSIPLRDLFIDVGMTDESVRQLVSVGDFVTLDRTVIPLQNDFVAGKSFDDRSSLVALIEFLRRLKDAAHGWDVYAVANVNEEDSTVYVGALTSTFSIRPHIAISLDVTHAQQPGLNQDSDPRVSFGPCIARGANVHPIVFEKLRAAAERERIPHHITVYGDNTETNAWMMQVAGEGVPTGLLEIPLRYMHTPVETIHLDDVMHLAGLLTALATSLTPGDAPEFQGETFFRGGAQANGKTPAKVKSGRRTKRARAQRPSPRVKRATAKRAAAKPATAKSSRRAKSRTKKVKGRR